MTTTRQDVETMPGVRDGRSGLASLHEAERQVWES